MIVPMKKISLVVMESEREAALVELRKLGIVHLVNKTAASDKLIALSERKNRLDAAIGVLRNFKPGKKDAAPVAYSFDGDLADQALSLYEARKAEQEAISSELKELSRLEPWGDFDPASFEALADAGILLTPYELSAKAYEALGDAARVVVLSRSKTFVRCLAVGDSIAGETPFALPDRSPVALRASVEARRTAMAGIDMKLAYLATRESELDAAMAKTNAAIEFEAARAGMERDADLPEDQGLAWLSGFIPFDAAEPLKKHAGAQGWALIVDDPADEEPVPTKLKNSPIVAIVQPIFDFLGTVPNYREYDVSAWFLLFFCFFFAMIFGDAVYGAAMFGIGALAAFLSKRAGKAIPAAVKLLMTLSAFTMVWGVLTLTYLGIDPAKLPAFLKLFDIYWISNDNPASGDNIKVLCFIIGTVQLSIAHIKNIKRDFATLKWLGQFGQLLMVLGMVSVVFNLVISSERFPIFLPSLYLLSGGFLLSFVFSNYEGDIMRSILASFANFVSVFLGVVNVFADIVSYIRLWAVGLAGLAISQTVNNMLGPLLGKFSLFAVGILALTFGHVFNIVLGFLSVVVHGVRLNMLEFSVHLGMEWSGFEYRPFKERIENNDAMSKEQL